MTGGYWWLSQNQAGKPLIPAHVYSAVFNFLPVILSPQEARRQHKYKRASGVYLPDYG